MKTVQALFSIMIGLLCLAMANPADAQSRYRRGPTAQAPTASASPAPPAPPPTAADPISVCANACSRQFNICIHGQSPDLQKICGSLPECSGLSPQDFAHANMWYGSCIDSIGRVTTIGCLPGCTPPKTTTVTTPQGSPPRPVVQPVVNPFKRDCEKDGGIYVQTVVQKDNVQDVHMECYKIQDMARDIVELKKRVTELEKKVGGDQPVVIDSSLQRLYLQVVELTKATNAQTVALQAHAREAAQRFEALDGRFGKVEGRMTEVERRVTTLETRQPPVVVPGPAPLPVPTVIQKASLPCWLGAYGQVNAAKTYNTMMSSFGVDLGCSLFSSANGHNSFVLAGGGGFMPNQYYSHTLAEMHAMAGGKFRLHNNLDLLLMGGGKWYNSTTWERGTISQYGFWPEIRYSKHIWFAGLRAGGGVQNVAPPLGPDQMANGRNTHFPVFDGWLIVGFQFPERESVTSQGASVDGRTTRRVRVGSPDPAE